MATIRQIEANQRNAKLSTGPKTPEGKAASKGNALTHGMSGEGIVKTAEEAAILEENLALWRPAFQKELEGPDAGIENEFLFEQVVLNALRMKRAQRKEMEIHEEERRHAARCWNSERTLEAERLGKQLAKNPGLILAELSTFHQGAVWLIDRWKQFKASLAEGNALTEAQAAILQDLLGIAPEFRHDDATFTYIQALGHADRKLETLETETLDDLAILDLDDRDAAERGFPAKTSQEERLNRRYEDLATRRFHDASKRLRTPRNQRPSPTNPTSTPVSLSSLIPSSKEMPPIPTFKSTWIPYDADTNSPPPPPPSKPVAAGPALAKAVSSEVPLFSTSSHLPKGFGPSKLDAKMAQIEVATEIQSYRQFGPNAARNEPKFDLTTFAVGRRDDSNL